MLPCFDAPSFKANFSMNLQVPSDLIALSNTPEYWSQSGLEPGTTLHVFETTPMMATYLIGVTVGHMVSTSAISDSGRNISIWSVPALGDQHAVPLQVTSFTTSYMTHHVLLPTVSSHHKFSDAQHTNHWMKLAAVQLKSACRCCVVVRKHMQLLKR